VKHFGFVVLPKLTLFQAPPVGYGLF